MADKCVPTVNWRHQFNWSADRYGNVVCFSIELWLLTFFVADQLKLSFLFYKTFRQPEQHLFPLFRAYMESRPSEKGLEIGGGFSLVLSACTIGPLDAPLALNA